MLCVFFVGVLVSYYPAEDYIQQYNCINAQTEKGMVDETLLCTRTTGSWKECGNNWQTIVEEWNLLQRRGKRKQVDICFVGFIISSYKLSALTWNIAQISTIACTGFEKPRVMIDDVAGIRCNADVPLVWHFLSARKQASLESKGSGLLLEFSAVYHGICQCNTLQTWLSVHDLDTMLLCNAQIW